MTLGFLRRFEEKIISGAKRHTIRARSKRNWRPGVMCDCFVNPRQKSMRCIGRWPCVKVDSIKIEGGWEALSGDFFGAIQINGSTLMHDECEAFARADGFDSYSQMMEFWRGRLPFEGIIIHWAYSKIPSQKKGRGRKIQQTGKGAAA